MKLNEMLPAKGSRRAKRRLGRGIGSTLGKTCGRGHKGLKSRAGGGVKPGFEGGQMPIQRRVPKFGFRSRKSLVTEVVRTSELKVFEGSELTLDRLKERGIVRKSTKFVKLVSGGGVCNGLVVSDPSVKVSKGARVLIESNEGQVHRDETQ